MLNYTSTHFIQTLIIDDVMIPTAEFTCVKEMRSTFSLSCNHGQPVVASEEYAQQWINLFLLNSLYLQIMPISEKPYDSFIISATSEY